MDRLIQFTSGRRPQVDPHSDFSLWPRSSGATSPASRRSFSGARLWNGLCGWRIANCPAQRQRPKWGLHSRVFSLAAKRGRAGGQDPPLRSLRRNGGFAGGSGWNNSRVTRWRISLDALTRARHCEPLESHNRGALYQGAMLLLPSSARRADAHTDGG